MTGSSSGIGKPEPGREQREEDPEVAVLVEVLEHQPRRGSPGPCRPFVSAYVTVGSGQWQVARTNRHRNGPDRTRPFSGFGCPLPTAQSTAGATHETRPDQLRLGPGRPRHRLRHPQDQGDRLRHASTSSPTRSTSTPRNAGSSARECEKAGLPIVSVACVAVGLIDFNPSVQRFHLDRVQGVPRLRLRVRGEEPAARARRVHLGAAGDPAGRAVGDRRRATSRRSASTPPTSACRSPWNWSRSSCRCSTTSTAWCGSSTT